MKTEQARGTTTEIGRLDIRSGTIRILWEDSKASFVSSRKQGAILMGTNGLTAAVTSICTFVSHVFLSFSSRICISPSVPADRANKLSFSLVNDGRSKPDH